MRIDYCIDHPVRLQASFDVEGFTVLLGQSGEGKTTLLRAIAGLLPAQGEPFGGLPPQHRAVGYLPQGYALFPHLRAWENVAFALPRSGASAKRFRGRWDRSYPPSPPSAPPRGAYRPPSRDISWRCQKLVPCASADEI